MTKIIIYSAEYCPYCVLAKQFFQQKNIPFTEIRVDLDPAKKEEMINLTHRRTIPQIIIEDQPIGGYDDLITLHNSGNLDNLLGQRK